MSLSARLGKLVGLFAPGTRLAHGKRMYSSCHLIHCPVHRKE